MPRGKYVNHKGRGRSFTSPEELAREQKELQMQKSRKKKDEESGDEEGGSEGSDDDNKDKKGKKDPMQQPPRDFPPSESSSEDEDEDEDDENKKSKGVESLIAGEIENPNRRVVKQPKLKTLDGPAAASSSSTAAKPELSRKEREAIEKQKAKERYQKLHAEGKTEEARKDLARLAIIRKQREEAAAKRAQEIAEKEAAKQTKHTEVAKALGKK